MIKAGIPGQSLAYIGLKILGYVIAGKSLILILYLCTTRWPVKKMCLKTFAKKSSVSELDTKEPRDSFYGGAQVYTK